MTGFKTIFEIARQTVFTYFRDRLFHSSIVFSLLFIGFCYFLATLTITESQKILLDFGLSALSFSGVMAALFVGITLCGKEIEKRTIYSILSKPVKRHEYLVGKFLGGSATIVFFQTLNLLALSLMLWKFGENFPVGYLTSVYLMLLESILLMAVALMLSLATSSLALASSIAFAVFLIGRSSQSLRYVAEQSHVQWKRTLLRLFYDVFPALDRFDIREFVAYSKPYPENLVPVSSLYFVVYVVLLLAASVYIFRRKDLT